MSTNVQWQNFKLTESDRAKIKHQNPLCLDKAPLINIGAGSDLSIIDLAELIKDIVGFDGNFILNTSKPDGSLRKVLNVEKINKLGWSSKINLRDGLTQTYQDFCNEQ